MLCASAPSHSKDNFPLTYILPWYINYFEEKILRVKVNRKQLENKLRAICHRFLQVERLKKRKKKLCYEESAHPEQAGGTKDFT